MIKTVTNSSQCRFVTGILVAPVTLLPVRSSKCINLYPSSETVIKMVGTTTTITRTSNLTTSNMQMSRLLIRSPMDLKLERLMALKKENERPHLDELTETWRRCIASITLSTSLVSRSELFWTYCLEEDILPSQLSTV
jgi:hypothetical protein